LSGNYIIAQDLRGSHNRLGSKDTPVRLWVYEILVIQRVGLPVAVFVGDRCIDIVVVLVTTVGIGRTSIHTLVALLVAVVGDSTRRRSSILFPLFPTPFFSSFWLVFSSENVLGSKSLLVSSKLAIGTRRVRDPTRVCRRLEKFHHRHVVNVVVDLIDRRHGHQRWWC
jgi:hypothetical protein